MTQTLNAALNYHQCGFSLFPLAYRSKDPKRNLLPEIDHPKRGKVRSWAPFQHCQPSEEQLKEWFSGPALNIALVMGEISGNVIALDFDLEEAYLSWLKVHPAFGAENTATAKTGKGYHVLFRMPPPLPRSWKITYRDTRIGETRGEGGYIAVWPSIHPSGWEYRWISTPWEVPPAQIDSLAEIGIARAVETKRDQPGQSQRPQNQNGHHPLPFRTRNFMNTGALGQSARGVNDELYQAAIQHAAAGYSEDATLAALMPVALKYYVGTGDGNSESQAERTIKSGWKGGQGKQPIEFRQDLGQRPALASNPDGPNDDDEDPPGTLALADKTGLKAAYTERGGMMIYTTYKQVKDDIVAIEKVIPFTGKVTQKLTLFDETTQTVIYTIEGQKDFKPYSAEITAQDFADGNRLYTRLLNYLPGKPPAIDPPLISRIATAIATITPEGAMQEIKALSSTGWAPDGKAFVLPSGAVGQSDYQCKLDPELAKEFQGFGFRQNSEDENKVAVQGLLDLFEVYRVEVVHTVLAHAFLPPLLRWLGDEARYLYHIHADTGSFKTELAKLVMSLYGPVGMNKTPVSVSTGNLQRSWPWPTSFFYTCRNSFYLTRISPFSNSLCFDQYDNEWWNLPNFYLLNP